jgi:transposase
MVASISLDLRQRVVDAYNRGGLTYAAVASLFSVGQASVCRWLRRNRETAVTAALLQKRKDDGVEGVRVSVP